MGPAYRALLDSLPGYNTCQKTDLRIWMFFEGYQSQSDWDSVGRFHFNIGEIIMAALEMQRSGVTRLVQDSSSKYSIE